MTDNQTLLGFIARWHNIGLEDAATDALYFILSRSKIALATLADFLGDGQGPLPIADVRPQLVNEFGAVPDLSCIDTGGGVVALIESKFWAPLTGHQPVTYWEALPADQPSALLFLAPGDRINQDQGSLWDELTKRLRRAGHELGASHRKSDLITATGQDGHRRLVLASWSLLLDRVAQQVLAAGEQRTLFEIAELQGLAATAIAGDHPRRDENLRALVTKTVKRVEQSGWANTSGLTVGNGYDYFVRYLLLAGADAWLGMDYRIADQMPDKPLWLSFLSFHNSTSQVGLDEIRSRLGDVEDLQSFEWRPNQICIPIELPVGADQEATLAAAVSRLEHVAKLIDPQGPTYADHS